MKDLPEPTPFSGQRQAPKPGKNKADDFKENIGFEFQEH